MGWERSRPVGFCRASVLLYSHHSGIQLQSFVFCYDRRLRRLLFVSLVVRAALFFYVAFVMMAAFLAHGRTPVARRGAPPPLPSFGFQTSGTGTLATGW